MIRVCETGRNPTVRHLGRTHPVSVDWLHERFSANDITLVPVTTDRQAADIYTKPFTNLDKWRHATNLINVFSQAMLKSIAMRGDQSTKTIKVPPFIVPPQVALQPTKQLPAVPTVFQTTAFNMRLQDHTTLMDHHC